MADVNRVLEIKMLGQRSEIIGIMVHVMAADGLSGTAVPATIMGDDTKSILEKEHHLSVPIVRSKRPTVAKHDRLARTPILVKNLDVVLGLYEVHVHLSIGS